jgi:hypothetical protein
LNIEAWLGEAASSSTQASGHPRNAEEFEGNVFMATLVGEQATGGKRV